MPMPSLSLRERAFPIAATAGASLALDLTAPGWTWVLGDTDAYVFGTGGVVEAVFSKSITSNRLTITLSSSQTSALGPGVNVWALRVGTQYWLGGRLELDLPGEDLDPEIYDDSVIIPVGAVTVSITLPVQAPPSGTTAHAATHRTLGTDVLTLDMPQISGLSAALAALQPLDSDLTAIAALAPANDDLIQRKAGVWTNRTMVQLKTDLALVAANVSDFAEVVRDTMGTALVAGSNVTITVNDVGDTITIAATGSGGTVTDEQIQDVSSTMITAGYGVAKTYNDTLGTLLLDAGEVYYGPTAPAHKAGRMWIDTNADPYGGGGSTADDARLDALETTAISHNSRITVLESGGSAASGYDIVMDLRAEYSPTVNGNNARNATIAARNASRNVVIPPGSFLVDNNWLGVTTTTQRMCYFGQRGRTIVRLEGGAGNMYHYQDSSVGTFGHGFTIFDGIWFQGSGNEAAIPTNRYGFQITGPFDQRYTWDHCYFHTLTGGIEMLGTDNASELNLYNTDFTHLAANGWCYKFANLQSLNLFTFGGKHEFINGSLLQFDSAIVGGVERGGGGQMKFTGSSIIIVNNGTIVRFNGPQSCVVNFDGCRTEIRQPASTMVTGNGDWLGNVVFSNGGSFTTSGSGVVNRLAHVRPTQSVTFQNWVFEDNLSRPDFLVDGGRLMFQNCSVYNNTTPFVSMVKWQTTPVGLAIARDCHYRYDTDQQVNFKYVNGASVALW